MWKYLRNLYAVIKGQNYNKKLPRAIAAYRGRYYWIIYLRRPNLSDTSTWKIRRISTGEEILLTLDSLLVLEGEYLGSHDGIPIYLRYRGGNNESHLFCVFTVIQGKNRIVGAWYVCLNANVDQSHKSLKQLALKFMVRKDEILISIKWIEEFEQLAGEIFSRPVKID